jgi:excisionase family DNA binding protein
LVNSFLLASKPKKMNNPFETLNNRLQNIERLLLDIKHNEPSPQITDQKELLSMKEAAKFLSLSTATIYSKVSRRELPCMKKNGRLYFIQSELMDYLKAGRKETLAEIKETTLDNLRKKGGKI